MIATGNRRLNGFGYWCLSFIQTYSFGVGSNPCLPKVEKTMKKGMSLVWESQSQTGRITPEKFPEMVRSDWRASEWTGLLVCPPNGSVRVLSKPKRMKKRWKYFGDGRVQTCILWKTAAKGICHDTACSAVLDPCLGINTLNRQILKMNRNIFFYSA